MKEKCRQLERENDEQQELLHEAEERERDCRWALQRMEKEKNSLTRKLDDAEAEVSLTILGKLKNLLSRLGTQFFN